MKLSDKTYNYLKYTAQTVLPALVMLWVAVANIWHLPYGEEIAGTIAAVNTALGILLGISSQEYYKGIGVNKE